MMNKKKNNAFTAFLITLSFLAPTISIFWIQHTYGNPSPLSKLEVTFEYADDTPIEDLWVYLYDVGGEVAHDFTDGSGVVTFEGLMDGSYWYEWSWQDGDTQTGSSDWIHITGKPMVWTSEQTLPYWTIEKTFYSGTLEPTVGLEVYLKGNGIPSEGIKGTTDDTGKVTFTDYCKIKAPGDYMLEWIWDETQEEDVTIKRKDVTPVVLNDEYLPLKSGGGK